MRGARPLRASGATAKARPLAAPCAKSSRYEPSFQSRSRRSHSAGPRLTKPAGRAATQLGQLALAEHAQPGGHLGDECAIARHVRPEAGPRRRTGRDGPAASGSSISIRSNTGSDDRPGRARWQWRVPSPRRSPWSGHPSSAAPAAGRIVGVEVKHDALPRAFHNVSVRLSPARLDVKAPETSNAQSSPCASTATMFTSTPQAGYFTSRRISVKPQSMKERLSDLLGLPALAHRPGLDSRPVRSARHAGP